mmetsp:Transcript_56096/g.88919  ORF Transcript_56096/g.88919 Transcript_56096/m.88919 type:complete len:501 (-) Transcript_56096:40-1542(-)
MCHPIGACGRQNGCRYCPPRLVAAAFLIGVVLPVAAEEAKAEQPGWVLTHHSFQRTLSYDDRLGDWLASAGTMALRDRLQLLPPVPDRYGLFWNKKAAKTKKFELTFNFRVRKHQKDGAVEDGMVAFWLSPDNFTASYNEQAIVTVRNWTQGLQQAGLTFISNRPTFSGVAVIFMGVDKASSARPSVSAIMCDGKKQMAISDLPEEKDSQAGPHQTKFLEWREEEVEVKIHATLGGVIVGTVQLSKSGPVTELFRLPAEDTSSWAESYFGFSGWSGSKSFLELDMRKVEMRNLDTQTMGEDIVSDTDSMFNDMEDPQKWKEVLEAEKRYIDQRSQKEAVERLTKLLSDYVEQYNKMGEKVKSDIIYLDKRIQSLDSQVALLVGSSKAINPETGQFEAATLRDHIVGIRSIFQKDKEVHEEKFQKVHESAKTLKAKGADVLGPEGRAKVESVAAQAVSLEMDVRAGSIQSSYLLLSLVLVVCLLGFLFLNRMRYYEKKHYI